MGLGQRIASMFVEITATPNKLRADLTRASSMIRDWSLVAEGFGGTVAGAFEAVATVGIQAITLGTAAAIAGFALATVESAKFEDAMVRTFTILGKGFDLPNSSIVQLTDAARLLGRETLFSATQAAQGMQILARSGFRAYEVIKTIRPVLNMAIVGNMEMAQSANIAVSALRSFQLAASDAGRVANVLSVLMSRANTDIEMAGTALSYVGAVAHGAGLSLEETGAAIGILSDAGISASKAGTTLRRVLTQLQAPSGQAQKIFDKLGLTFTDATGDLKPFVQIIDELSASGITAADTMRAFGLRGGPGMQALIGRGAGALRRLQEELENSTGAAERMAQKFRTTIMGRTKDLQASLVDLGLALTEDLQKPMADTIFGFRNFIKSVVEAGKRTGAFKAIAKGLVTIMEPLVKLAEELGEQFLDWFKNLSPKDITEFFEGIRDQITTLIDAGKEFGEDFVKGLKKGLKGVNLTQVFADMLKVSGDLMARVVSSTVKGIEFLGTLLTKLAGLWDKLWDPLKDGAQFTLDMVGAVGLLFNYLAPVVNMFIALAAIIVPISAILGLVGVAMGGLSLVGIIEESKIFKGLLETFPEIWETIKAGGKLVQGAMDVVFAYINYNFKRMLLQMAIALNVFVAGMDEGLQKTIGIDPKKGAINLKAQVEPVLAAYKELQKAQFALTHPRSFISNITLTTPEGEKKVTPMFLPGGFFEEFIRQASELQVDKTAKKTPPAVGVIVINENDPELRRKILEVEKEATRETSIYNQEFLDVLEKKVAMVRENHLRLKQIEAEAEKSQNDMTKGTNPVGNF